MGYTRKHLKELDDIYQPFIKNDIPGAGQQYAEKLDRLRIQANQISMMTAKMSLPAYDTATVRFYLDPGDLKRLEDNHALLPEL